MVLEVQEESRMKIKMVDSIIVSSLEKFELERERRAESQSTERYIRPSMISGCSRMIVYYLRGEPLEIKETPQSLRILKVGHYLHYRIQKLLVESGLAKESDVELPVKDDDLWLRGHCDAIIEVNNEKYIFEFKTVNSWSFSKLIDIPDSYKDQATLYMHCLKIPRTIFLFENKDTQEWREFLYFLDELRLQNLLLKIREIQDCVKRNILPRRECTTKAHGARKRCPFVELCFGELP